jgi:hypothetical protein
VKSKITGDAKVKTHWALSTKLAKLYQLWLNSFATNELQIPLLLPALDQLK